MSEAPLVRGFRGLDSSVQLGGSWWGGGGAMVAQYLPHVAAEVNSVALMEVGAGLPREGETPPAGVRIQRHLRPPPPGSVGAPRHIRGPPPEA